jgi:hypothetical protein
VESFDAFRRNALLKIEETEPISEETEQFLKALYEYLYDTEKELRNLVPYDFQKEEWDKLIREKDKKAEDE